MTRNAEAHGPSATINLRMVLEAEAEDNPAGPEAMSPGTPVAEAPAAQSGALPQGSDMLTTFLSLMPDAAVAVDGKGTIVAVNERTEAFFGYSADEVEGKSIELLVPERFRHSHRRRHCGKQSQQFLHRGQ